MPFSCYFWVLEVEPPGGVSLTARRHLVVHPVYWVLVEGPGGDEQPPGDANQFWFDFDVVDVLG